MQEEGLALTLLVLGILATDDAANDFALTRAPKHEAAVFADRFYGGADFHGRGLGVGLGFGVGAGFAAGDAGTEGAPGRPVNGASACKR